MKIFSIILSLFLLTWCVSEYRDFHSQKKINNNKALELEYSNTNFSLEDIWYIDWLEIKSTPNLPLLDDLVDKINNAENRVYVQVYIFTEKRLRRAVKNAYLRWLDVKVVLEDNVYLAPTLNNETYRKFNDIWVPVVYSNPHNYSLNHTKMMIIDDEAIISTWNYSYSAFRYNREFFLFISDKNIVDKLVQIFNFDYFWVRDFVIHNNIILSPFNTRNRFESLINWADKSIKIYSLNFSDIEVKNLLIKRSSEVDIKMIFPPKDRISNNFHHVEDLIDSWVQVSFLSNPSAHAKAILIDDKYLYIWSVNFSRFSIDENREVWLLISNKNIIEYFISKFYSDFVVN